MSDRFMPHSVKFAAPHPEQLSAYNCAQSRKVAAQPYQTGPRAGAWIAEQRILAAAGR